MTPQKKDPDAIQGEVTRAIDEARAFVDGDIKSQRLLAERYESGEVDLPTEEGRSKVVATKCRDVKRAIKPILLKMFLGSDNPIEFVPRGPESVQQAEQATEFAAWKFQQCGGFKVLHDAIDDALVKKCGFVKVFYDDAEEVEIEDFSGVDGMQLQMALQQPGTELLEHGQDESGHFGKLSITKPSGGLRIESVPPEEFFVDSEARSIDDFHICGHSREMCVGDLVEMGFEWADVHDLSAEGDDDEALERVDGYGGESDPSDPALRRVLVTECYMRLDIEGTGIPSLYQFICGGTNHKILSYELADDVPFAVFEVDPEPHAFFGRSLVELVKQDQDASTSLLRGLIDNVHQANNQSYAFDENRVEVEDMLSNQVGRMVRVDGTPGDAVMNMGVTPVAAAVLPALQYYDMQIEERTGISRASAGLNPDALRNATATAVDATVQAREGQAEVIARHLAEGMKRLSRLILKVAKKHAREPEIMRLRGQYVPFDPRAWDDGMDMTVNVGLGTGQREERIMALQQVLQWQQMALQMGMTDPMLMRNTIEDLIAYAGLHNVDRYFYPQPVPQQPQGGEQADPNAAYLQAEQMKAQVKAQSDQLNAQIKAQSEAMKDDRERDKMEQDALLELLKMQNGNAQAEAAQIRQLQAQPR